LAATVPAITIQLRKNAGTMIPPGLRKHQDAMLHTATDSTRPTERNMT